MNVTQLLVREASKRWPIIAKARTLVRAYEAAQTGRLTAAWANATGTSANTELVLALPTLRNRTRDLVRNNPHAGKAIEVLTGNTIGDGIVPRPACVVMVRDQAGRLVPQRDANGRPVMDDAANAAARELWARWVRECDAEGLLTFAGLQSLAARSMFESGEVLVRRRRRRASDGLSVPLQLQLLEADFLDSSHDGDSSGGRTIQGIAYDALGRRKGYWLYQVHPGDSGWVASGSGGVSVLVPADDVAHLYQATRPGQCRGVPWLAPVAADLRMLDDYQQASLVKRKVESMIAAFVLYDNPDDAGIGPWTSDANTGKALAKFGPGMIVNLPNGKDVRFAQPTGDGTAPAFVNQLLHDIAAGAKVPHELMTGDLSQVNYSSIRAGLIEFRRMVSALQTQIVAPLLLDRVWGWFVEAAVLSGALPDRDGGYPVIWQPPRFEEVDRETMAKADLLQLASLSTTIAEVIAKGGRDPHELLHEAAEYRDLIGKLGLAPEWLAKVQAAGASQPEPPEPPAVKPPLQLAKPAEDAAAPAA